MKELFVDYLKGNAFSAMCMDTGTMLKNRYRWHLLSANAQQFWRYHEQAHYELQTYDEDEANWYAFNKLKQAGGDLNEALESFKTVLRNLPHHKVYYANAVRMVAKLKNPDMYTIGMQERISQLMAEAPNIDVYEDGSGGGGGGYYHTEPVHELIRTVKPMPAMESAGTRDVYPVREPLDLIQPFNPGFTTLMLDDVQVTTHGGTKQPPIDPRTLTNTTVANPTPGNVNVNGGINPNNMYTPGANANNGAVKTTKPLTKDDVVKKLQDNWLIVLLIVLLIISLVKNK